ncbi:hypothetical protein KKE60_04900, partial [Patescibacteria group bacterium]|nr:hypothetical protein [Patescibacteria group bacterium]
MNKLLLLIGMCILFVPIVYAVQTEITFGNFENGLVIQYPPIQNLKQNESYEFEFHVYNKSNGVPVVNGISCDFHLYNGSGGNHMAEEYDDAVEHIFDYTFDIDGSNFSEIGDYSYLVSCNDSTRGGFDSVPFMVTKTGNSVDEAQSIFVVGSLIALVLALIGTAIIIVMIAKQFKNENKEENKWFINWWGLPFRSILYVFALGFCSLAIGGQNIV